MVDNNRDSLRWVAGTLEKLMLHFEGTAGSRLGMEEIIDLRMLNSATSNSVVLRKSRLT
jgi:hypothetical protein